jgi:DNA repair protein RadC
MTKIKDLPAHKRPREKLAALGAENLSDKELLAILLRTGRTGKSALDLAGDILAKGGMKNLLNFKFNDFSRIKGLDKGKAAAIMAAFELAKRALEKSDNNLPMICSARAAAESLSEIAASKKENLAVLYLNARNELVKKEIISIGTIDASLVHPREVFEPALRYLASRVIVAHNHPSGNLEPSEEDIKTTKRLLRAGDILGIEVLDHLIITAKGFISLKEKNLLPVDF